MRISDWSSDVCSSDLNHSCDPNVLLDTERSLMVARRDIARDEELSFFYPSTEWEMDAPFICLCGSSHCIHVVAGARRSEERSVGQEFVSECRYRWSPVH